MRWRSRISISYATQSFMSVFVMGGTVGAVLAMPVSSFFVHQFGVDWAIWLGVILQACVVVLIAASALAKRRAG